MKKFFTLLALLALTQMVSAVPAKRTTRKVRQSDGTTLMVTLRGDEHSHFCATLDGKPIVRNVQGDFVYAEWCEGAMRPSSLIAHEKFMRTAEEQNISAQSDVVCKQLCARRAARLKPLNTKRSYMADKRRSAFKAPVMRAQGERQKGLIILVNFKDVKMQTTSTPAAFDRVANTENLTGDMNYGSIRDYFKAQSYGQFDVTFDIAGPYTLSKEMAYYGANDPETNEDMHAEEMVYEAVKKADNDVNFKDYDWDGDGEVENIYVVYAGYGEASYADENTIWPHQFFLRAVYDERQLKFDGVLVDTYACGSELYGDGYKYDEEGYPMEDEEGNYIPADYDTGVMDGVGTMCHEFSHCLGLPDFYDTEYQNFGMSVWSVMEEGCNNLDGYSPCNYTAYERWFSGWLEPKELSEPTVVQNMAPLANEPEAYVIYNDKNHDEYYLLANHQFIGFDLGNDEEYYATNSHGLMVMHVTYDQEAWYSNTVNVGSVERMTIIPADGECYGSNQAAADYADEEEKYYETGSEADYYTYYYAYSEAMYKLYDSWASDLWPNVISGEDYVFNRDLTDESSPAATLNTPNTDGRMLMHKSITDITEVPIEGADELYTVSFKFMGGKTVAPATDLMAEVKSATAFTAKWTASEDAASYNVQLRDLNVVALNPAECVLLSEDFAQLTSSNGKDGKEVTKDLDSYLNPGWTGLKIFIGGQGCKIGNREGGYLLSPTLTPENGGLTVVVTAVPYNKDAEGMTVYAVDAAGRTLAEATITMNGKPEVVNLEVDVPCQVKLIPTLRCFITGFTAYDGIFTAEEIAESASTKRMARAQTFTTEATSYDFTDLTENGKYAFRVQAVDADSFESAWTEWAEVELVSIEDAIAAMQAAGTSAEYFDLQGRRVAKVERGGVYIVRKDGQVQKVLVR